MLFFIILIIILVFFISGYAREKEVSPNGNIGNGNVGASCKTHDQCETPVMYSAKSSCPHFSICIENRCKVVCPRILSSDEDPNHPTEDIPYISPQVKCSNDAECKESCSLREWFSPKGACLADDGKCYCI